MSPTEHVLIVGTGRDFPARIRAVRPGARTSVICQSEHVAQVRDPGGNARVLAIHDEATDEEWIALAEAVHARDHFTRIGTFGERDQHRYAVLGEALGLRAHSRRTMALVHDKTAMRTRLAEAGVDTTACGHAADPAELAAFVRAQGTPCIVKPVSGTASAGVTKVVQENELAGAFARAAVGFPGLPNPGVLIEEFLPGPQFSVEAFSELGEHLVVGITRKYSDPVTFAELGHVSPAALSPAEVAAVGAHTADVLDALGVEFGPTHTEIVLTAAGPRVVETHVRMGGDMIPALTLEATGIDIDDCAARQTAGDTILPSLRAHLNRPRPTTHSAVWFAPVPVAGTLEGILGLEQARTLPGVTEVDAMVPAGTALGEASRAAYARASGPTAQGAADAARRAAASLEFRLRTGARAVQAV